jgi:long-chain fatty acid transport protein
MKLKKIAALLAVAGFAAPAFATNGMNMEGYGPIATGMGGASYAFDNGTAALANNPATLGFMKSGTSRFDLAVGGLQPDVHTSMTGFGEVKSGGTSYIMPGFGYIRKDGQLTWGAGVMAQGGMGTEYSGSSFLAQGTGQDVRSEVGVGRLILPLVYSVNDNLNIGGSLDWVWATMDIKMAASAAQFNALGTGMSAGMGGAMAGLILGGANTFRIDFSDHNDYSGAAYGSGLAGKLGVTYKVNQALTVGATYHSKTNLGDMSTSDSGAAFSAFNSGVAMGPAMGGKITIHNFQWPETYGLGLAYQASDKLMVAADYKRINWSKVMKDFNMTFSTGALGGADYANFKINQNWDDQNVFMLGASYKMNEAMTLRVGANFANNPVPDNRANFLFPAIVKDHYTAGLGYEFDKQNSIDFSLDYAPKVTVNGTQATNGVGDGVLANAGMTVTHSQTNWQFLYSHRF